jgi:hypothetical protein
MTETTYERFIQIVRIGTAAAFAVSGIGSGVCVNLGLREGAFWLGVAAVSSLVVVALLIVEQLVAAWIRSGRARFSVAAILLVMAACSVFFALVKWSVAIGVALFVLTLTLISIAVENKRRTKRDAREVGTVELTARDSVRGSR